MRSHGLEKCGAETTTVSHGVFGETVDQKANKPARKCLI